MKGVIIKEEREESGWSEKKKERAGNGDGERSGKWLGQGTGIRIAIRNSSSLSVQQYTVQCGRLALGSLGGGGNVRGAFRARSNF